MTKFGEDLQEFEKYCRLMGRRYPILAAHVLARTLLDSKKGNDLSGELRSDEVLRMLSFATVLSISILFPLAPFLSSPPSPRSFLGILISH